MDDNNNRFMYAIDDLGPTRFRFGGRDYIREDIEVEYPSFIITRKVLLHENTIEIWILR